MGYHGAHVILIISENMVKIGQVLAETFLGYADFCPVICPVVAKISISLLVICGVTGRKFT